MNPYNLWNAPVKKMSRKEILQMVVGIPTGLAAIFAFLHFTGKHFDYVQKLDDAAGRTAYTHLVKAADIDTNGILSDMEKKLLCARMDKNIPSHTSPIARSYHEWSYCMAHPPLFFGGDVRKRAEKALEMYRRDTSP